MFQRKEAYVGGQTAVSTFPGRELVVHLHNCGVHGLPFLPKCPLSAPASAKRDVSVTGGGDPATQLPLG